MAASMMLGGTTSRQFPSLVGKDSLPKSVNGTFGGTDERNVRTQNKATVQGVAASKFVGHCAQALAGHQGIHENMYSANINDFNSLKPGHIIVALNPVGTPPLHLVLGEVVTMYTKNTMHDWIPTATSVGAPSYICIQGYASIAGPMFTSMSCPKLACGSFLQIPRTHLIFSFASFDSKIMWQQIPRRYLNDLLHLGQHSSHAVYYNYHTSSMSNALPSFQSKIILTPFANTSIHQFNFPRFELGFFVVCQRSTQNMLFSPNPNPAGRAPPYVSVEHPIGAALPAAPRNLCEMQEEPLASKLKKAIQSEC
ncbi:hypothetical protein C8F04DRAFT_1311542 [Mycena alexandri]|uniref:Uncharacterized protein n=1 Tax=Mycena alexandri TaxID=1745969 RepID=A0AAD6WV62_9AGAR|nr:hypothetical protein C8F04DRAFT_1311542 [Mycena alexandri]